MNKERRKTLQEIINKADDLKTAIEALAADLESVGEEEQEYYDNMPESFQDGEKGERAQEAIDYIESAVEALENAVDGLDEAMENIESAKE